MAINTYFKNIADAIRTKTGGSGLITPANMPDEILNIVTGSPADVKPLHTDMNIGWFVTTDGEFRRDADSSTWSNYRMDMYPIHNNHNYLIGLGSVVGGRFRVSRTGIDLYTNPDTQSPFDGSRVYYNDSPARYLYYFFNNSTGNPYLYIYKSSSAQNGIKTFLFDMDEI